MIIHSYGHTRVYEMEALLKLFVPAQKFAFSTAETPPTDDDGISACLYPQVDGTQLLQGHVIWQGAVHRDVRVLDGTVQGNVLDREISALLYPMLCACTGLRPAWGMLTGIRPVNLLRRFEQRDGGPEAAMETFRNVWHVTEEKTQLAARILEVQRPIFAATPKRAVSVYVSIPFCPTRCKYCSFVSNSVTQMKRLLPQYLDAMRQEIRIVGEMLKALSLPIDTMYIGGGTPTVLDAQDLDALLGWLKADLLDANPIPLREYTVEAGRPDTITKEKLAVLQAYGVDRISVNPQSFQNAVLEAAGRPHTAEDTIAAYRLAKEMGFDNVNMDFIAGLPCDTVEGFSDSIRRAIDLQPESITVHCLALKKAADFYASLPMPDAEAVRQMVEFTQETLQTAGYRPYYLYRQKNMAGNLENVGYALPGKEAPYNILMMDDSQTILGIGSGASTKLIGAARGIQRVTECKYPYEYLERFAELMEEKRKLSETLLAILP